MSNNNNNNLRLIRLRQSAQRYKDYTTWHTTVCMQGSNDIHTRSRKTVATTRFSPEKVGRQKRRRQVLLTVIQWHMTAISAYYTIPLTELHLSPAKCTLYNTPVLIQAFVVCNWKFCDHHNLTNNCLKHNIHKNVDDNIFR